MKGWIYIASFSLLISAACVDRLAFEKIGTIGEDALVVEGYITDQPGPYEVRVSQAYNIDTVVVRRIPVVANKIFLSDNLGNTEELLSVSPGVYRTDSNGIQGAVGRAYKLRVEMPDARVYETSLDTMKPGGVLESITHEMVKYTDRNGVPGDAFDIFFYAKAAEKPTSHYMWKTSMVYKIQTNPEDNRIICGFSANVTCPAPLDCSGYIIGKQGQLEWVKPCTCCFCWITIRTEAPIVSDNIVGATGYSHVKIGQVPITGLTMKYKTHIQIQQYSLSENAYRFWKAFRAQKDGIASLFQPVNGKIPSNWVQVEGKAAPIFGVFYASSVTTKDTDLDINDVPDLSIIPPIGSFFPFSCLDFDNSTNIQPDFWN